MDRGFHPEPSKAAGSAGRMDLQFVGEVCVQRVSYYLQGHIHPVLYRRESVRLSGEVVIEGCGPVRVGIVAGEVNGQ